MKALWENRPPYVIELTIISVLLTLVMTVGAFAMLSPVYAGEVQYITPRIPSEQEKVEALQLGYILNGFSMVRHPTYGSIDVSTGFTNPLLLPPQGVVRTIPIDPKKKKDRER